MKNYQIYELERVIGEMITQDSTKRNSIFLYKLLKNRNVLKSQIETIDSMFDITKINGYELFDSKRQQIINEYRQEFKDQLSQQMTQDEMSNHNYNLSVRVLALKQQEQLKSFFEQLDIVQKNKIEFLSKQYEENNLKKITLQQIKDIQLSGSQMNTLMVLIQD